MRQTTWVACKNIQFRPTINTRLVF